MKTYLKNVTTLEFNPEFCTGCLRCIEVCPHEVFRQKGKKVEVINRDSCMECGACMMNCAYSALHVDKGVGCAAAIIFGALNKTEPNCDCNTGSSCCG
jgi:NAD-dependent dihydropyrimidine dehydrogenase PreA subunit